MKSRPKAGKKPLRVTSRKRARPENLLQQLGVLRIVLISLALLDMLLGAAPGTAAEYRGWAMVPTLIMPVLAPILLQVLLLDALMGRILMSSAKGSERARYRRILVVNLLLSGALVLWWLPYFLKLFAR